MRSLSLAAIGLLGVALIPANAQQARIAQPAPSKGQGSALTSASRPTQVSPILGTRDPIKVGPTNGPSHNNFVSGGSDLCALATVITGSGPFTGDNISALTDGPSSCGALAADVWYDWTAPFTGSAIFSLCGSNFDTVIAVYDTAACTGVLLCCNDDFCGLQSEVMVSVVSGNIYKIQIGGFSGSTGTYTLSIMDGCSGASQEGEAGCGLPTDTFNGGCNSIPAVYSAIACGGSVCGNCACDGSYRDTDWYHFTIPPGPPQLVTWTSTAEFNHVAGLFDNNCPPTIYDLKSGSACTAVVSTATLCPGTYTAFMAPDFSQIITCGTNDNYLGTLTCVGPQENECHNSVTRKGEDHTPFKRVTMSVIFDQSTSYDNCGVVVHSECSITFSPQERFLGAWHDTTAQITISGSFSAPRSPSHYDIPNPFIGYWDQHYTSTPFWHFRDDSSATLDCYSMTHGHYSATVGIDNTILHPHVDW